MKFFKKTLIYLCILSTLMLFGCSNTKPLEPLSKTELIMGTICTVQIFDSKDNAIIDKCFNRLKELENLLSINKPGTELDKINEMAGKEPVKVSDDTFNIIKSGIEYGKLSKGHFDITIGPIVKLWGIGTDHGRLPKDNEIQQEKSLINYEDIVLNEKEKTVFLKNPKMIIDLGGIAKGYAADSLNNILAENKIESAMINLGGNLYIRGNNPNGNQWRIGIQDPNNVEDTPNATNTVGNLLISNKSLVTSGTYERFIIVDGKKYHHIMNPKTGYPYENDLLSVSIISDKSIDGDALSTATFALGCEEGLKFINSLDNIEAIFITKDNKVYTSKNLEGKFNVTNNKYKLVK